jgi:aspartate kinase
MCIWEVLQLSRTHSLKRLVAVIKIGGSVLTGGEAYKRAAQFIKSRIALEENQRVVVVVSAREGETDALENEAKSITREPISSAMDLLWSTGEVRSTALLGLHLHALGVHAATLNIHEAGLQSGCAGREGFLSGFDSRRLDAVLGSHKVVIVPGFFATNPEGSIVSLGRGGSDLTAVFLAEKIGACICELIKDVPGYFTCDPHLYRDAQHLPALSYQEALKFADTGCELVQKKAIEAAAQCGLRLVVRSLDEDGAVTSIGPGKLAVSARNAASESEVMIRE